MVKDGLGHGESRRKEDYHWVLTDITAFLHAKQSSTLMRFSLNTYLLLSGAFSSIAFITEIDKKR